MSSGFSGLITMCRAVSFRGNVTEWKLITLSPIDSDVTKECRDGAWIACGCPGSQMSIGDVRLVTFVSLPFAFVRRMLKTFPLTSCALSSNVNGLGVSMTIAPAPEVRPDVNSSGS